MTVLIFIFGLCVGSFLNVVIIRTYEGKKLGGRSECPECGKKIFWYDNIPLISYLVLRGKCRHCRKKISLQYPLVELATGLLFVLAYINSELRITDSPSSNLFPVFVKWLGEGWGGGAIFLRNLIFISFLIIVFVQDLRWYVILDTITLPAGIMAIFLNLLLGMDWKAMVFGAIIGGGFFGAQFLFSRGRWIGGGDIRLGAVMGVILGWKHLLFAFFVAYILGASVAIFLIFFHRKKFSSKIQFGTFLSASTIFMLLFGDAFVSRYMKFIGW